MLKVDGMIFLCEKEGSMAEDNLKVIQERLYQTTVDLSLTQSSIDVMQEDLEEIDKLITKHNQTNHDTSK